MRSLSRLARAAFAAVGLRVTRLGPANRFDAMADSLRGIASAGFEPTLIIDVGANMGQWARTVSAAFPCVPLHLVEPQAACRPALLAFGAARGLTDVHSTAITRHGCTSVRMTGATGGSSGARVLSDGEIGEDESRLPATTLDQLFAHRVQHTDWVLLKLDMEGHELAALDGAEALLRRVEVLVTETQFYDIERTGTPTFSDLLAILSERGFVLYDLAALASRPRDGRLRMGDAIFVRRGSALIGDDRWA